MNDSNHTLRFSRSYQEATGQRCRASDFEPVAPRVTGKEVIVWLSFVAVVCILVAIWR